ncbi:hypothetical protein ANANG_G00008130 [Anguilla anguilla]|uniref:Uncharacterized protein n=1 Tax=Anguilla anguilla TaxID=7936 RepID=A0A9D3S5L8_ANGAN|nr:hypothetical protein ANANG_G00008130 [Anguilla anguilla]
MVVSHISFECEKIRKAPRYEYLLPATSSGNRSDPGCDASWTLKNGTVIAVRGPYPNFTAPAVHVEDDRLLTDHCERDLFYHMDCIDGISEEIQFHSSDPTNAADNGYWWIVLILIIVVLCLAAILVFRRLRRGRLFGRKEPCQNVDKSSSDEPLV